MAAQTVSVRLTLDPTQRNGRDPFRTPGAPDSAPPDTSPTTVNIQTGQTVAFVKFEDAVQEIFAVQVLPGVRCPDVINDQPHVIADSFVVPHEALDRVTGPLHHAARENKPSIPEEMLR